MIRLIAIIVTVLVSAPVYAADITARETLPRGTILTAEMVDLAENGTMMGQEELIGKELKRAVYKGYPIRTADVQEPVLVKRNALVRMTYAAGPLSIQTQGRAMEQGALGDVIAILNLSSRARVYGTVSAVNKVEVYP